MAFWFFGLLSKFSSSSSFSLIFLLFLRTLLFNDFLLSDHRRLRGSNILVASVEVAERKLKPRRFCGYFISRPPHQAIYFLFDFSFEISAQFSESDFHRFFQRSIVFDIFYITLIPARKVSLSIARAPFPR